MQAPLHSLSLCAIGLLTTLLFVGHALAQQPAPRGGVPSVPPAVVAPADLPALQFPPVQFVTALCRDLAGNIWIGSEDQGIWSFNPTTGQSKQYLPKDGLGDEHCYALACDDQGRIWAGHQSHGVSVFNGDKWQNYETVGGLSRPDSLSGPLGERVFDIEICPTDGDIWIATSLGLSRYSVSTGQWSYTTRMDGLPSDQIQCLAFEKDGTLWAGSQCDGLAVAKGPAYKAWKQITGPDKLPLVPGGLGLPSNLINDLLVGRDGTIWVATTTGLAFSRDRGRSFRFVCGADWSDKVKGLYTGTPKDWQPAAAPTLTEDYITCLAEDSAGRLWVGHRQQPYEVLNARDGSRIHQGEQKYAVGKALKDQDHYVTRIIPSAADAPAILGRYGFGLAATSFADEAGAASRRPLAAPSPKVDRAVEAPIARTGTTAELPRAAAPALSADVDSLLTRMKNAPGKRLQPGEAVFVGDDWATKGDWTGRYGRQFTVLCAANSPMDHEVAFSDYATVNGSIGPHHDGKNALRYWVHWPRSDDPRVLYNPCLGYRRQSEWDDNGESYAQTYEGPDVWASVAIPAGVHYLSFYFFNKDGHEGPNRYRDYVIEVRQSAGGDYDAILRRPMLAITRVRDFWGGTYKTFAVAGPSSYLVKIAKNASFNVIVSSVMVDCLAGPPANPEFEQPAGLPRFGGMDYGPKSIEQLAGCVPADAIERWKLLDTNGLKKQTIAMRRQVGLQFYRWAVAHPQCKDALDSWRWPLHLWTPADRAGFAATVREAREKYAKLNNIPLEIK